MELGLKGKVAVVTGSSQGIGRSIAEALAREGVQVVINSRNAKELEATAEEMRSAGATVHAVASDVTDAEGAKRPVEEAVRRFKAIHILVNNAGGAARFGSFDDLTDEEWLDVYTAERSLGRARHAGSAASHAETEVGPRH